MTKIKRFLQSQIEENLFKKKVIILYGARQVGKTTLVKEILKKFTKDSEYFSGDEPDVRQALTNKTSSQLRDFLGNKRLIVIDEAQRIKNIGLTLKLLVDNFPKQQIIATGSSAFELSNKIIEPLTGRAYEYFLPPIALNELLKDSSQLDIKRNLERFLIYGMYPEVVLSSGKERETRVRNITKSYLYKDILTFQKLRHTEALEKLLQALALQIGHEVSLGELSRLVGIDKNTVSRYLDILEKAFIIFRLKPFSRNLRTELRKLRKIYFWDMGVRNSLIRNFNLLNIRNDVGALFENFCISERYKRNLAVKTFPNTYFWRTRQQQEIDYLEDENDKIRAYEFKFGNKKDPKFPKKFETTYKNSEFKVINQDNFLSFIGDK